MNWIKWSPARCFPCLVSPNFLARLGFKVGKSEEMARRLESTSKEELNHVPAAQQQQQQQQQQQFSSVVDGSKIRGRGKDKSNLMLMLGCQDDMVIPNRVASGSTVPVILIAGATGIGKNTLVRTLLQDQNVWKHFDNHIYWVSVSGQIDDKKRLASAIIQAIRETVPPYYE